jgi:short-subunit dehydrogenase
MNNLKGKNAILTGASRGIGTYIAREMAGHGINLVLAARSAEALESVRQDCERFGVKAIAVTCDVTSRADLERLVSSAEREFGRIDILVNNAGIELVERLRYLSFDQIDQQLTVNLNAPIWLTRMVLPGMLDRKSGAIVNVASLAGKGGVAYSTIYSASKHGLVGFSEGLGLELDGTGVTVGVVCPGLVDEAGMWATHKQAGAKAPPMAGQVSPQKVADAVMRAIGGVPEVLVNATPMKPLLAFGSVAPGMKRRLLRVMKIDTLFREEADRLKNGDDRPEKIAARQGAGASSNGAGAEAVAAGERE